MESSSDSLADVSSPPAGDGISLRRWFAVYLLWLLAGGATFVLLAAREGWSLRLWEDDPGAAFAAVGPAAKLLGFALYLSLCCTFVPLPSGAIVAALATRQAALAAGLATTVLLVALAGAFGSTLANLNDYYMFTAMLRHRRIRAVRNTRTYQAAARWFARAPFFLVLLFSILPVPVDVVRALAATHRYDRLAFAAANFIGRFIRYGVIAFATYFWDLGWAAPAALLGLAVVIGAGRLAVELGRRLLAVRRGAIPTRPPG